MRKRRGHLNLSLLPSSNMSISFTGDDGCTERLAIVANDSESLVKIEEISADSSGRSFLLKLPGSRVSYFWCSEKSKLYGMELVGKMKDLLRKNPSLSHLTGICESRLDSFATHLRAYLIGSINTPETTSTALTPMVASSLHASNSDHPSSHKSSRDRLTAAHTAKVHPFYQGSLSPRSTTFKDGMLRSPLSNRSGAREKLRRRGDSYSSLLTIDNQQATSVLTSCTTEALSTRQCEEDNSRSSLSRSSGDCYSFPCCLPEIPSISSPLSSFSPSLVNRHPSQVTISSPLFSPYYCWCPPCPSPLQYTVSSSHLPITSESLPLPPLSSLLSSEGPPISINPSKLPIKVANLPSLSFPSLFPETLVRLPLPVSSHVTLPSSQQIPTFTPFMSDPIVHIPMIDVCSAGQGYLVSAGPAISSAIAPLLPSCVSPLIPETESVVEKSARETLRMLMASAPMSTSTQSMNMLPKVLNTTDENIPCAHVSKQGAVVTGSRCLYSGTLDVKAVASGISFLELFSSRRNIAHGGSTARGKLVRDKHGDLEEMDPSKSPRVSERSSGALEGDLSDQEASV